ncbi:MAG: hypothetical protein Q8O82_10470 [Pseudorhodobacter sp.]|nr:hypothetical protein [Pseudorhodobacter sp.]
MKRLIVSVMMLLSLAACGAEPVWAPDEDVARAAYSSNEPPSVTLYTVISTSTGAGGHSALLINGKERVMFDPAGTWYHPAVPERNDVHYGITDRMRAFYIDYHARERYFVREQTLPISLELAEELRARVEAHGAVPKAFCANSIASVLRGEPGFENVPATMSPVRMSKYFDRLAGVTAKDNYDGDPANYSGVMMVYPEDTEPVREASNQD